VILKNVAYWLVNLLSDGFNVSQVYAIIVLPNGGPDLEAYTFAHPSKNGWRQACSLFWQVARTLARAEELVEFEVCPSIREVQPHLRIC
jgi:hypothetical protein